MLLGCRCPSICRERLDFGECYAPLVVSIDDRWDLYQCAEVLEKATTQTDSFVAWQRAMYSASVDESATHDYFFDFQLTAPSPILTMYASIVRRSL